MKLTREKNERLPLCDEKIIALYFDRDEKAIEETDFKYQKYLFSIINNALANKLDSEECLNETYLGAWNAMPPTKPNLLKAFLAVIARRIAIRRYHVNTQKGAVPSEMTVALSELEDFVAADDACEAIDTRRLSELLNDFVRSLSERRQFIFIARYYTAEPIDRIASELSVSRSTVNKELAAIRSQLKEKLESEGCLI